MRIRESRRGFFWGTHKGCDFQINREPDGRFYIIVTAFEGGALYDGWAPAEVTTMVAAKREALYGACLKSRPGRIGVAL